VASLINKDIPWGFLDGASQGNLVRCVVGLVLFSNDSHIFKLKLGAGNGTNRRDKLLSL
jgi:hypothetical protein